MIKSHLYFAFISAIILTVVSCSKSEDEASGGVSTNSAFLGRLTSLSASSFDGTIGTYTTKTITHVMAISPATANSERYISEVGADGSFSLGVNSGKPYIIVFVSKDGVLTGPDMIVSTVKISSNDLDSLAIVNPATIDLGDVSANATTTNASVSTSVDTLLTSLGLSADEGTYLGAVDDLTLRLANPDIDMNGEIDALENKTFGLDWHVRADSKLSGSTLLLTDVQNTFADENNVTLDWTLASAYAVYPKSYDDIDYIVNSGVSTALQNGGALAVTGTAITHTSASGGTFSDSRQWGPDYDMSTQEIAGSDTPAVLTFTLGSVAKQLRFNNVKTKTKAQLNSNGVLLPFVKINTSSNIITGLDYKWMKKSGSTWIQATATEVSLMVQSSGAYMTLYTQKSSETSAGLSFTIPSTSATGTITVGGDGFSSTGVASPTNVALSAICNVALSYDDKMGLRLFAGAPLPASVTCP
ncbi:MAG: hypothetical protein A2622_10125 [Bdellovibrionales bacterium RIFCSPHIGHO2_01_FULL_40_29]|nr:MAG: hypothetical protein A2622_10125 [Bdellovibrionales bacterium RIFCSPHIGHO2_01_FULL_40_29]OFZ32397.1 MAG: hypothetical protein A3D17_12535 [Bdellovibrionales bacterium RIFCSPHIGHO2_02_FULL_40_15]